MATQRKMVVVMDNKILPEIGNITGPIVAPTKIPMEKIKKMIVNNREVYECNPANPSQKVRLGLQNLYADNFAEGAGNANPGQPENPNPQMDQNPAQRYAGINPASMQAATDEVPPVPDGTPDGTNVNENSGNDGEPAGDQEPDGQKEDQPAQQNETDNAQQQNNNWKQSKKNKNK